MTNKYGQRKIKLLSLYDLTIKKNIRSFPKSPISILQAQIGVILDCSILLYGLHPLILPSSPSLIVVTWSRIASRGSVYHWFTKKYFHEKISDHDIRYCCLSVCLSVCLYVCLSVCPEHSFVSFDPILIKFWWEVYIMI